MADVFVRRTTGFLLIIIAVLFVICVALSVSLLKNKTNSEIHTESSRLSSLQQQKSSSNDVPVTPTVESATTKVPDTGNLSLPWELNIRIPDTTIPYHYDLLLHPDLVKASFTGRVSITIGVTSNMEYLQTHMKLMNVTLTELKDSTGSKRELVEAFEYKPNEFWVVRPKEILAPGNYTLTLEFNGQLKGHIVGFYMSEYTTKTGEKRSIATSKFQPTEARRAFPCFDEPSFKSTFKTTLVRPSKGGYIALSNMPIEKEIPDTPSTGLTTVKFENSVPMVTYLACFIVCDFDYVEALTADKKKFRVYSTSDQVERTHYARDIGVNILNYFETYFEVEYPLPKQDMIAIPDFVSGAMEHWGLITFRETNLLYDEIESSSYNKQRVAIVISHELAHMWFGNLVTLKWWDDLWLNEGFASYIEYKGVHNYEKNWLMMDQFLINDLHPVFKMDQILSSHPIVQPVNHPNEITEIFDKISYSKGASVLRMLEDFLGAENFRIGVRNFILRFKYGNAVTQDLWDDLQKVSSGNLNVTRIMDSWTRQMGFPVINVQSAPNNKLEINQERFLIDLDAKSKDDSPFNYKWDIPVTFKTDTLNRKLIWFKMNDPKITVDRPQDAQWIKFNVDQYGYYRVNYDAALWSQLIKLLNETHQVLSSVDRSNLIDDSFSLAASGRLSYDTAFQIISYLTMETEYVPWSTAYSHLKTIGKLLQNTDAYELYRNYVRKLVDQHVDRVGWEDLGSHTERRNRINILSLACSYGHERCILGAVEKFKAWVRDPTVKIPANLRTIIYVYGIKGTGEKEWNFLFSKYLKEINAQEKIKMLKGLTSTKEPWIANRFLNMGRNQSVVRRQDFFSMVTYMAYNPSVSCNVWRFIRSNWEWMVSEFGLDNRYLGRTIRNVAYEFTTPLELKELQSFFEEYPEAGSGKRARLQAVEKVNQNIKWIETYAKPLQKWLGNNNNNNNNN